MSGDDRPVFLVGFMGSGKSAVGRALADLRGWAFADLDGIVEASAGRSIEAIFRESGEGTFRTLEWEALSGLSEHRSVVVATGGGTFTGTAHRSLIRKKGRSVWLDVPLEVAAGRVGDGAGRPLWSGGDPLALRIFYERRRAAYALADLRVDASLGGADEIARRVELALSR